MPFTSAQRLLLLFAFALLVALRLPGIWAEGRFLDEEATVFLAYAWHHPWADALFRPFAGYLNLAANATTLLTVALVRHGALALEHAPYVTMTIALGVQLLPAVLILTGRAGWLARRSAVVVALLLVALAPASEEVFLNVLHIQFHLALCAALILALDAPSGSVAKLGYGVLLLLAPLCGPGAIVLLPLFALRALVDRDAGRAAQMAAFGAGAALQLLLFFGSNPMRGHLLDPFTLAATLFVRMVALPALNFGSANRIGYAIYQSQVTGGIGWWVAALTSVALFGALLVLALRRCDAAVWLLLSSLGIATASFGYGMVVVHRLDLFSVDMGERYNFLPLVLLGWTLVALAMREGSQGGRVCGWLCLLMLLTGAIRYPDPVPAFNVGPSWTTEVAAWRRDHAHQLAVWPKPWRADLSDRARPCHRVGRQMTLSDDPRYCESGWVAGFVRLSRQRR